MASGMGTQQIAQVSGEKRVRSPFLKRMKRLIKGYIKNRKAYKAYRQWRHRFTGPLRMTRADVLLEDHHEQKALQAQAEQKLAAQFTPLYVTQTATPEHPIVQVRSIPLCSGAPVQVARTGDLVRRYHEAYTHQALEGVPTQPVSVRPVRLPPMPTIKLTPLVPEVLPERIGITKQEERFLLDQPLAMPEEDSDQTIPRIQRIQKAG